MLTAYGMLSAGYPVNACEIYKASDAGQQSIAAGAVIDCSPAKVIVKEVPRYTPHDEPKYSQDDVDRIIRKAVQK